MKKLIFGCGYLGSRVAQAWIAGGDAVMAVTRSQRRAAVLQQQGIQPQVGDLNAALDLSGTEDVETVLFAVGFDRLGDQSIFDVYVGGLRNVLACLSTSVQKFIYISSTGVYSQSDGQWVDEASPCEPIRDGGKACLAAEQQLRADQIGSRAVILRLAGIYGPDRLPMVKDVIAGNPIPSTEDGYLNLIHVDDAVQAVLAAETRVTTPETLIVSDGTPVVRGDFYREMAKLCNAPIPRFVAVERGSSSAQRASTDKRINNQRMRECLAVELKYPTCQEGLAEILRQRLE